MKNPNIELLLFLKDKLSLKSHTKEEIALLWLDKKGVEISLRTVDRNVEFLRQLGYNITSGFIDRKRTYRLMDSYEHEMLEKIENQLRISEMPELATNQSVTSPPSQKGIEWLPVLLESINNHTTIEFQNHPFTSEPEVKHVLPLIFKEYQGRWHIHAYDISLKKHRTFGIDRILDLRMLEKWKKDMPPDSEREIRLFKMRLGAARPLKGYFKKSIIQPEIIKVRVSSFYLNYLSTKPMHHTQKIFWEDKVSQNKINSEQSMEYTLVEYFLVPNYDLIKFIVSQLGHVILEEPIALKKYISQKYKGLVSRIA